VDLKSTSVKLHVDTIELLKHAKEHPRETYDDVIKRLLKEGD